MYLDLNKKKNLLWKNSKFSLSKILCKIFSRRILHIYFLSIHQKFYSAMGTSKVFLRVFTSARASISSSTFSAQDSSASLQRATSQTRSLNLREVSLSSQDVCTGRKKIYVYEREADGFHLCSHKQASTLQLVSLRSDFPSCRITLEVFRSCCAVADSCRLLPVQSDTVWRRPGFEGSADILVAGDCCRNCDHEYRRDERQENTIFISYNIFNVHFADFESVWFMLFF